MGKQEGLSLVVSESSSMNESPHLLKHIIYLIHRTPSCSERGHELFSAHFVSKARFVHRKLQKAPT